jgi:Flp pilus assembly pilin Flp
MSICAVRHGMCGMVPARDAMTCGGFGIDRLSASEPTVTRQSFGAAPTTRRLRPRPGRTNWSRPLNRERSEGTGGATARGNRLAHLRLPSADGALTQVLLTERWTKPRLSLVEVDNKSLEGFMFFSFARPLTSLATRLACDDTGADLIEYALLTALFALVGFLGVTTLSGKMGSIYSKSDNAQQGLWIPDAPTFGS